MATTNVFTAIPVPLGSGVGAGVSVADMVPTKTITVAGSFTGGIQLEGSDDDVHYLPLAPVCTRPCVLVVTKQTEYLRARSRGVTGAPTLHASAPQGTGATIELPVPPGNDGIGDSADISTLTPPLTFACSGAEFLGSLSIEGALAGGNYADVHTFGGGGTKELPAPLAAGRVRTRKLLPQGGVAPFVHVRSPGALPAGCGPEQTNPFCGTGSLSMFTGGLEGVATRSTSHAYSGAGENWIARAAFPENIYAGTFVNAPGDVGVYCGGGIASNNPRNLIRVYDIAGNSWSTVVPTLPQPLFHHAAARIPAGLLAVGEVQLLYSGFVASPYNNLANRNLNIVMVEVENGYAVSVLTTLPAALTGYNQFQHWGDYSPCGPNGNPGMVFVAFNPGDGRTHTHFYDFVLATWDELAIFPLNTFFRGVTDIRAMRNYTAGGPVACMILSDGRMMGCSRPDQPGVAGDFNAAPILNLETNTWELSSPPPVNPTTGENALVPLTFSQGFGSDCNGQAIFPYGGSNTRGAGKYDPVSDTWQAFEQDADICLSVAFNFAALTEDDGNAGSLVRAGNGNGPCDNLSWTTNNLTLVSQSYVMGVDRSQYFDAIEYPIYGNRCGGNMIQIHL